jgi:uncharacterized protein (DUF362 family)
MTQVNSSSGIAAIEFVDYAESIPAALDAIGADRILARQPAVMIKPNLVNAAPFPVTTAVACCAAIVDYVQACSSAKIVIAEGCGDAVLDTDTIFRQLRYDRLAAAKGLDLIDLNSAPLQKCTNPDCVLYRDLYLPQMAASHYIVSVPVLKAHSLAEVTGTLKNMMGLLPPDHYGGGPNGWKKAQLHRHLHRAIAEINRHRCADLTVMDASVGLADFHLGGARCDPPLNQIIAGYDPLAVDRHGAALLGRDWKTIGHLAAHP